MPKNIVLCADGTGNKGGTTPDSNVFKIYKAVNKHFGKGQAQDGLKVDEQIVFYDNGVGTKKNKYLRMLGGAFGFGFEDNVCDLYKFLSRNYEPGDRIYFFGFSRGASTVRACNGFIATCGLVKGKELRNRDLDERVKKAFDAYKVHGKKGEKAEKLINSDESHGVVDIHFMGVWDTVVALGFPKRTDITGPVSAILNGIFRLAEEVLDRIWPHSFYNYKLTDNLKHAYQALAIDDERTAFWPFVWWEKGWKGNTVEQVWFAGMHSNVGGGYGRSGMAGVALYWMMLRAEKCGLAFDGDAVQKAFEGSHVHGRMYNSRDGFAIFYRYHPREIEKLCEGRFEGDIRIHRSVVERINHRTANYAPGQLPGKFVVVESDTDALPEPRNPGKNSGWGKIRKEIDGWVLRRKRLYGGMLAFSLAVVLAVFLLHGNVDGTESWGWTASFLRFFLPDFFDGFIKFVVEQHYYLFVVAVIFLFVYWRIRCWCYDKSVDACERLRWLIIQEKIENREKGEGSEK